MLKYSEAIVGLREIPDEISLCINISGCEHNCKNCHSPYLKEDIGTELNNDEIDKLITRNSGISCICFMGGDNDLKTLNSLAKYCVNNYPNLKRALYIGADCFPVSLNIKLFNFIKIGHYDEEKGPLDSPKTNQRLKQLFWNELGLDVKDITYKFWNK